LKNWNLDLGVRDLSEMFESKRVPNKKQTDHLILEDRRVYKVLVKEKDTYKNIF
jgi:hypothetical protein